jgi:hypothetical protein
MNEVETDPLARVEATIRIDEERDRQDAQWGPAHDDQHTEREWLNLVGSYIKRADLALSAGDTAGFWRHLTQITAVCKAAVEADWRRKQRELGVDG